MYIVKSSVTVLWVGDGCSAMSVPAQQKLQLVPSGSIAVATSPTTGSFNTALWGSSALAAGPSMANDISNQIAAQLTRIQNWSSGGG